MTGFGFVGPMTAMGTVFNPKEEAAAAVTVAHYPGWQMVVLSQGSRMLLFWL